MAKNNGKQLPRQYKAEDILPFDVKTSLKSHPSCKVCNSKYKEEVEQVFEKTKNVSQAHRFLKEKGENLSVPAVGNHMREHYGRDRTNHLMKTYADDILQWVNFGQDKETSMKIRMAAIEREMHVLASQGDDMQIEERRKNSEQVRKLAETLLSYESKLVEIQQHIEPIQVVFNQLKIIMLDKLKEVRTDEAKGVMAEVLNVLQEEVGEYLIEEAN
jgi:hypothetical protein|tara:strand:+ start:1119 stop:1766 length:648 start_codon:yes stop_codon:yes gene_type:complete